jgi:D-inositol-3-phosphate glycosyltransferase
LQELLRQFAARSEADCVVRSVEDGPLRSELTALGFSVEVFQNPSILDVDRHDRATDAISDWLVQNEFDCVLANPLSSCYAINAAYKAGLPSVWAIHESFPLATWSAWYTGERPGSEFFLSRIKAALGRCSAAIFESDATRRMFIEYGNEDRFLKIPYGINASTIDTFLRNFDRDQARSSLGFSKNSQVLLCMATVELRKQQIFLTQAFAEVLTQHDEANLLLVGDYPTLYSIVLRQYMKRKRLGRKIQLFPIVQDPYRWYALADSFVLMSDVESMPRSVIEAMGFGLPVLASKVFGVPELIDDGETGFLIEPNSLRKATEGLNKLLCLSSTKRELIARAAKEKIKLHHDSRGHADAYLSLISGLVR